MRKVRWKRRILGIVLGAGAAMGLIAGVETIATTLYPFAPNVETLDADALAAAMTGMPLPPKLMVVFGWALGAFGGAWFALRICDWKAAGWTVALLIAGGGIANILALPHPVWMQVAAVAAPLLGGWLAQRLHHKPYRGEPLLG